MKKVSITKSIVLLTLLFSFPGCFLQGELARPELPSLAYTRGLHQQRFQPASAQPAYAQQPVQAVAHSQAPQVQPAQAQAPRASYHFVKDFPPAEAGQPGSTNQFGANNTGVISNMHSPPVEFSPQLPVPSYQVTRNTNPNVRPYQGPLHIGEPGASASLWRAQGEGSRLFRDHRAFQPMDLITIIVSEDAEGTKKADTDAKKESTFLAGINELFNFADNIEIANTGLDTATLLDANFESEFKGEGETTREGSLKANIAAMVVEVLPNGVMRVEGEKILSVNNEEQVLVISGLVRPRDVSSNNEVMSSKIAHLRIDYFGKGTLGDVQYVGWFGRMVNALWPF